MKNIILKWLLSSAMFACALMANAYYPEPKGPLADFVENKDWKVVDGVTLAKDGNSFSVNEGDAPVVLSQMSGSEPFELLSRSGFGDAWLKVNFMVTENTLAWVYIQSRYALSLSTGSKVQSSAALQPGALLNKNEGVSDLLKLTGIDAAKKVELTPGKLHSLELKFRAPRYDEANNKTDNAMILEAKIDDVVIHSNTFLTSFSYGAKYNWEEPFGPLRFILQEGSLVLSDIDMRHADFAAVEVPAEQGKATNLAELTDFVAEGKEYFTAFGCGECHAVGQNDTSFKTGPNLFGLLTATPRDREVVDGSSGGRFTVKADRSYLHASIRNPGAQLAIREQGEGEGEAYLPVMPPYSAEIIADKQIEALGAYIATLNTRSNQGPVVKLVTADGPEQYDPMEDGLQFLVGDRVRIQRGPIEGLSGRSIHVGQPGGIHYSFDPRLLAVAKIWQGGFLDVSGEWTNRGGKGLKTGFDSQVIDLGKEGYLLAPLNKGGKLIDFSFKESVFGDTATIEKSLYNKEDHLDLVKAVDAAFKGYEINTKQKTDVPVFNYRIGENTIAISHQLNADGELVVRVKGQLKTAQQFSLNSRLLADASVSKGEVKDLVWTLPAGKVDAQLSGKLQVASHVWQPEKSGFNHLRQKLNVVEAKANMPAGYQVESYLPPKDNFGRSQLFEALGIAVAPDGTIVVSTRTAGIWRIVKGEWHLFAEGAFDSLGVVIEDKKGLKVVIGQKAELTRVSDTNGDGLADKFETLFDSHSYHSNYHAYMHGPVKGGDGAYYVTLNLSHTNVAVYKADGKYMGSEGGLAGWAIRVTPEGKSSLWANGLRSPAGISTAPDGTIWYADNQGEFVSTSKLFVLEKDKFYGHPSGLVDLPGMTPDSPEIAWENVQDKREHALVLFPHNQVANSPGHPVWDTTKGKFSAFNDQIFIGDQTQSNLLRVTTETVDGTRQGAVMPFIDGLESGVMRPVFLPDGSLLVGQTGRGWQARGGHVASLQRIWWDRKTVTQAIHHVAAKPDGFEVTLTQALDAGVAEAALKDALQVSSWVYRDAPDYGSPTMDERKDSVKAVSLDSSRKVIRISLDSLEQTKVHPQQTARVYHIQLTGSLVKPGDREPGAFYTLYKFPQK